METVDVNITAGRESVGEPWIWRLSREFNVKVTVLKANVDTDYGWMQLQLEGPVEEIQRATAWLMTTGMHVEALQRSVGVSK
jgi:ABC-type methionine transport system ATPase subunit